MTVRVWLLEQDGTVSYAGHPSTPQRAGLPTDTEIALPVRSGGRTHGRFLLTASTRVVRVRPNSFGWRLRWPARWAPR